MKRRILLLSLLVALFAGATAPAAMGTVHAQQVRSHPAIFDKTRFAFHLGLAYFAFHHFVYKPYRAGSFKAGAAHRTASIVKAGAALLITYHELKKAYDIAKGSKSGLLQGLVKPLSGLIGTANRVANKLRGGQYSDAEVRDMTNSANAFSRRATHNGINIKDITVPGLK